jgi:hypothetical protein
MIALSPPFCLWNGVSDTVSASSVTRNSASKRVKTRKIFTFEHFVDHTLFSFEGRQVLPGLCCADDEGNQQRV